VSNDDGDKKRNCDGGQYQTGPQFAGARPIAHRGLHNAAKGVVENSLAAAIDISAYNPEKDPDGSGAKQIVELLTAVLAARREKLAVPVAEVGVAAAASSSSSAGSGRPAEAKSSASAPGPVAPAAVVGDAWSSDSLELSGDEAVDVAAESADIADEADAAETEIPASDNGEDSSSASETGGGDTTSDDSQV
jgi:hypothetical protein